MLRRVTIDSVKLPKLYIAEDRNDVKLARAKGIPYVKWNLGMEELIRQMLRPTLEKMFPAIKWDQIVGPKKKFKSRIMSVKGSTIDDPKEVINRDYDNDKAIKQQKEHEETCARRPKNYEPEEEAVDIAKSKREFIGTGTSFSYEPCSIETYVGDLSSYVNIETLQNLNLLPKFIGDIVDCIKINLSNSMRWHEGYNKKRGVPIGTFGGSGVLPNLIILDVSGSIPRGISATMLTLIDTMRTELDADLIITASRSVFYPHGTDLPSPQALRDYFGFSNEAQEFYAILDKYVAGRKWGHVISFGDYDTPADYSANREFANKLSNTSVMAVHHYHTNFNRYKDHNNSDTGRTGYAEWVHVVNPKVEEHKDESWCKILKEDDNTWR